jgi:glycosyltransferase involved in cell wall biosynthesis
MNADRVRSICVVLPAYNEEGNITPMVVSTVGHLEKIELPYRIVVVDDGSRDNTPSIIDNLAESYDSVIAVHQPNGGYGAALRRGFLEAVLTGMDWTFFTDSDQQFRIEDLDTLMAAAEAGADFVAGYRVHRADLFMRRFNGAGWTLVSSVALGMHIRDIDCAFKLFKTELLGDPTQLKGEGATINPELLLRARRCGAKIVQVGVNHYPRQHGSQTGADLKVILRSFVSLARVRFSR